MGQLRLYAISIDHVRDLFGADDATTQLIWRAAEPHLTPLTPPRTQGLLSKLGPIFRRDPAAPAVDPEALRRADVDDLIAGRYPPPGRLPARWQLVEIIITERARSHTALSIDYRLLDDTDFSLGCVDVASHLGLETLLRDDLRLGIPLPSGLRAGYTRGMFAIERAPAYLAAAPRISEPDRRAIIDNLASWLAGFAEWDAEAALSLDLMAFYS